MLFAFPGLRIKVAVLTGRIRFLFFSVGCSVWELMLFYWITIITPRVRRNVSLDVVTVCC